MPSRRRCVRRAIANQRIGYRATRHRGIRIGVVEAPQGLAAPAFQHLLQAFGKRFGAKHAAIEQQRVGQGQRSPVFRVAAPAQRLAGDLRVHREEGGNVAGDRRVGG